MRKDAKAVFAALGLSLFFLSPAVSRANTAADQNRSDTERFQYPLRVDTRRMSPSERVRFNTLKVKANPSLKDRWDPQARRPASPEALPVDNLAMKIISDIGKDEALAAAPLWLKVRALNGDVLLEGVVNSAEEKSRIQEKVRRMDGVRSVKNEMRVKASDEDFVVE